MIFRARYPRFPPQGRIDGVIYWGAVPTVANLIFYAADLDTNNQVVVPQADLPSGPPSGAAGGDLGGTYPNPSVETCPDAALSANVPIMTAGVLPAVDGSLLTNLPAAPPVYSGQGNLDGSGQLEVDTPTSVAALVASWIDNSPVGQLWIGNDGSATHFINSTAGAADSGKPVYWIAF